jgi:hypothetical protein
MPVSIAFFGKLGPKVPTLEPTVSQNRIQVFPLLQDITAKKTAWDHIRARETYEIWREEHVWNVRLLQTVHLSKFIT